MIIIDYMSKIVQHITIIKTCSIFTTSFSTYVQYNTGPHFKRLITHKYIVHYCTIGGLVDDLVWYGVFPLTPVVITMLSPKCPRQIIHSLKLTKSHLKIDAWKTILSSGGSAYFQRRLVVSFREGTLKQSRFRKKLRNWDHYMTPTQTSCTRFALALFWEITSNSIKFNTFPQKKGSRFPWPQTKTQILLTHPVRPCESCDLGSCCFGNPQTFDG